MKLNKEQNEFLKWLWQSNNKAIWIETFIKINNKTGKSVPFKPTIQQKEFLEGIERKNIILKLRQNGMSVISLAEMLRLAITKANTVSAMYSYEEDSAKDNFDKLKQMYYSLPNWIREQVKLDRNNDISLEFSNGSVITAKTVGTGRNDKGRGKTINGILHLTEFAFYKNAEKQLTSLSKSCSSSAKIIVESTANGVGNLFHSMWLSAINKESSYKAFFFPWFTAKELFDQDYKIASKEYKKIHKCSLTDRDLDEEERQLFNQHKVTLDMLMWRRLEIANDGGLNKFHQERPAFPDQAFLSTGAGIFDNDVLNMLEQSIQRDLKLNKLTLPKGTILKELPKELHYYYNKELKVYHKYNSKLRHYVGVDCGKGLGQDYTVVTVYNSNKEECAIFRSNKIAPWEMSSIVKDIGLYYGKAMLVIETASGGDTILDKLKNTYKYPTARIYKYKSYVNRTKKTSLGFNTNNQTKSLIIENLKELIESRQDSIQINSIEFVQELKVFVDENGKMGAMGGYHDDIVMATAICLYALVKNVWGQIWF